MDSMPGMNMSPPPSTMTTTNTSSMPSAPMPDNNNQSMMSTMMHMTFFWGSKNTEVLFTNFPGASTGHYYLALFLVFLVAFLVELVSRSRLVSPDAGDCVRGLVLSGLHMLRMGLAYLVMLAVMSFNGGVFLAAIIGHGIGFLVFGTRIFCKGDEIEGRNYYVKNTADLPPMNC
ncbi:hypothetical protein Droror1_Dr00004274 [Drosera rotundifolia]